MIDLNNPTIQGLIAKGYRLAAHAYVRSSDRVNYTYVAKDSKTGQVIQGWSAGGDASDALADLARKIPPHTPTGPTTDP